MVVQVIEPGCSGCAVCVEVCPVNCIASPLKPPRLVATVREPECIDCMICVPACPTQVIVPVGEMTAEQKKRLDGLLKSIAAG